MEMVDCDGEVPAKGPEFSDGGGGGGGGSGSEDRLSALPDDILIHILLKILDAAAAARTSVLSSRWCRIWTLLPELDFPFPSDPQRIGLALAAHEALVLRRLAVGLRVAYPESVAAWLPIAARRLSGHLCIDAPRRRTAAVAAEGGAIELPCFENATAIRLDLGFRGLAVPPLGVFAGLTDLLLSCIKLDGPCLLGDAVSSPRCPALRKLTVLDAWGLGNFAIHSDSLRQIELKHLHDLYQLTVMAPALKVLLVTSCFAKSSSNDQPVANISAPQLVSLEWRDPYDPRFTKLGQMKNLQWLATYPFRVYGRDNYAPNTYCVRLLQRFQLMLIRTYTCVLIYPPHISNKQYLMEDITRLPDVTNMFLRIMSEEHSFGASVFHFLRICTGVKKLVLALFRETSCPEEQPDTCAPGCVCARPSSWKIEEVTLNRLQEVSVRNLRGTEHEAALINRLFGWATVLENMTITFHCSVTESKAKEFFEMLQSFSRTEIRMKGPTLPNLVASTLAKNQGCLKLNAYRCFFSCRLGLRSFCCSRISSQYQLQPLCKPKSVRSGCSRLFIHV